MPRDPSVMHQFGFDAPAADSSHHSSERSWRAADGRGLPLRAPSNDAAPTPPLAEPRRRTPAPAEDLGWEAALARARLRSTVEPDPKTVPTHVDRFVPTPKDDAHWHTAMAVARARADYEENQEAKEWEAAITRARARTDAEEQAQQAAEAQRAEQAALPGASPGVRKSAPTLNLRLVRPTGRRAENERPLPGLPNLRRAG